MIDNLMPDIPRIYTAGVDCLFDFYFSIEKKIRVVEKCIHYSRNVDRAVGFSGINR